MICPVFQHLRTSLRLSVIFSRKLR
jgi:hypothetical protein